MSGWNERHRDFKTFKCLSGSRGLSSGSARAQPCSRTTEAPFKSQYRSAKISGSAAG